MLEMKYFVLNPKSKSEHDTYAMASREAMKTYAYYIKNVDPYLYRSLKDWVDRERTKLTEKIDICFISDDFDYQTISEIIKAAGYNPESILNRRLLITIEDAI